MGRDLSVGKWKIESKICIKTRIGWYLCGGWMFALLSIIEYRQVYKY